MRGKLKFLKKSRSIKLLPTNVSQLNMNNESSKYKCVKCVLLLFETKTFPITEEIIVAFTEFHNYTNSASFHTVAAKGSIKLDKSSV